MKPCANNRQPIAMLTLDKLESIQAEALRAHMVACEGCRVYYDEMQAVRLSLDAIPTDEALHSSAAFHRRVMKTVLAASARRKYGTWQFTLKWRTAIAVLCLLAILAVVWAPGRHQNPAQPESQPPAAASAAIPEADLLAPTAANYMLAANQSPEALDDLLAKQIQRDRLVSAHDRRPMNLAELIE